MPKIGNTECPQDVVEAALKVRSYLGTIRRREELAKVALTIESGGAMTVARTDKDGKEAEPAPDEGLIILEREVAALADEAAAAEERFKKANATLKGLKANATKAARAKANKANEDAARELKGAGEAYDEAKKALAEYQEQKDG